MGFFDRNREELRARGIDPARLPPGQYATDRFPVLHVGDVPRYADDLSDWDLRIFGLVDEPLTLTFDELTALPTAEETFDIHCVTKWSKFDTRWTGVRLTELMDRAGVRAEATHLVEHAEHGYTTNLPLTDVRRDDVLVAWAFDGEPLEPEHGHPLRLVLPHRYFWKSAKWLRGLEFTDADQPGFWERNGYHNEADPFLEQRHWGD
jgi:DMSO/TMAO reductase YedYZ molybdopterin-dependent catalytic subunit